MGINNPHKNIIGNLKKLENVWASNTSLTETEINKPKNVEVTAIKIIAENKSNQLNPPPILNIIIDRITGIKAFTIPNKIAPDVFANINFPILIGDNNNLSNDFPFLSKVIVTDNIEVVPNNIDMVISPGSIFNMSNSVLVFTININVHAIGNIIPQLILGGLR